eukprot:2815780-Rhodomonas_salina.1
MSAAVSKRLPPAPTLALRQTTCVRSRREHVAQTFVGSRLLLGAPCLDLCLCVSAHVRQFASDDEDGESAEMKMMRRKRVERKREDERDGSRDRVRGCRGERGEQYVDPEIKSEDAGRACERGEQNARARGPRLKIRL